MKWKVIKTEEEYNAQAQEYTVKALSELREYCQSPKCNTWKIIRKLKTPDR